MKTVKVFSGLLLVALLLTGCRDPLTRYMDKHNFTEIIPPSEGFCLCDIYDSKDINEGKAAFSGHRNFTKTEQDKIMGTCFPAKTKAYLGQRTFTLNADAKIIGELTATLENKGVKKFKVKAQGEKIYKIDESSFRKILNKDIVSVVPHDELPGKYYVYSLLQVDSLEYEFFNEKGLKINFEPGTEVKKKIDGKIDIVMEGNESENLVIDKPTFIGYRVAEIKSGWISGIYMTHVNSSSPDFVMLKNKNKEKTNIAGYMLIIGGKTFIIPKGTTIDGDDALAIYFFSKKDKSIETQEQIQELISQGFIVCTNIGISKGEKVILKNRKGVEIQEIQAE